MTFDIFKLYFQSPLHLSRGKLNTYANSDDVLHSDTIKSALYATALDIYDKSELPPDYFDSFQVSSAYPFEGDELWLPRPFSYQPDPGSELRKALKKVEYLPKAVFEAVAEGDKTAWKSLLDSDNNFRQPKIFEDYMTQRVQISLEDARSTPFYIVKHYPMSPVSCGLYFMVQQTGEDAAFLPRLKGMLKFLGENGIGLNRRLGNGQFRAEHSTMTLREPENANAALSLSLYSPTQTELDALDLEKSAYLFTQRGGWIASPENEAAMSLRKRSFYMFSEGSVFKTTENAPLKGRVVDVAPDDTKVPIGSEVGHEVWRDGKSIFFEMKI